MFNMKNVVFAVALVFGLLFFNVQGAFAIYELNGTVYDINGNALAGTNVSLTLKNMAFTDQGTNTSITDSNGWFRLNISDNAQYMYQLALSHINTTYSSVDFVGQSLPAFPYAEFSRLNNVTFYLKPAGTINITVMNSTSDVIPFGYQVKDTKLGYPVASSMNVTGTSSLGSNVTIYVPADRNYSIMVYPAPGSSTHFMPVSYDWNNFSASYDYQSGPNTNSTYNATTKVLKKRFNVTEDFAFIQGYINQSSFGGLWRNFTVITYLMEPGSMISPAYGVLPYNVGAWRQTPINDNYTNTSGYYNITLPYAPSETVKYILFAVAENTTGVYGSYRNLTMTGNRAGFNFTMYGLLGTESFVNLTVAAQGPPGYLRVNVTKQNFVFTNSSTNNRLARVNAHVETKLDYTDHGAMEFTVMEDVGTTAGSTNNFSVPLINVAGVKEINAYTMGDAPKRIPTKTATQISLNSNISLSSFNPSDIDGALAANAISIALYKSSAACDVPTPPASCLLASTSDKSQFNPFSFVIGGGRLSFRMGSGGVYVHLVNVDLLASGPPEGLFDSDRSGTAAGTSFNKAMRFGSGGPKIYDYAIVSIPYSETAGSGLNDAQAVSISIPVMYEDNWTAPIWNTSLNGTNASNLAGNFSHYQAKFAEWQTLMGGVTCTGTLSIFNATNPCYINTTSNTVWLRLPHFSGSSALTSGTVASAAETPTGGQASAGGGGLTGTTYNPTDAELEVGYKKSLMVADIVNFKADNVTHRVYVSKVLAETVEIQVTSATQMATLKIGETKRFNVDDDTYYDLSVKLNKIAGLTAELVVTTIHEAMPSAAPAGTEEAAETAEGTAEETAAEEETEAAVEGYPTVGMDPILISVALIVVAGAAVWYFMLRPKARLKK